MITFNEGEWVNLIEIDTGIIFDTFKYDSDYNGQNGFILEKWIPKEGELVIPSLIIPKTKSVYISGFEVRMWTLEDVYDCEPYQGPLPSFMEDNRILSRVKNNDSNVELWIPNPDEHCWYGKCLVRCGSRSDSDRNKIYIYMEDDSFYVDINLLQPFFGILPK